MLYLFDSISCRKKGKSFYVEILKFYINAIPELLWGTSPEGQGSYLWSLMNSLLYNANIFNAIFTLFTGVPLSNLQRALIPKTSNWSRTIFGHFLQQTGSSKCFSFWAVFFCFSVLYFSMSFRCPSYFRIGRWLSWKGHKDLIFYPDFLQLSKGQLISKCLLGVIVSTKKPTKFL